MDHQLIFNKTLDILSETARLIRKEKDNFNALKIEVKGANDFVTHVDKAAEEHLVSQLSKLLPESSFLAEEGTGSGIKSPYLWIIDPIDGTTNFIHGAPPYSISVALQLNSKTIFGAVYEITADECFYSFGNDKAFLNGEPIQVSETPSVSNSLIATGFPYSDFGRMEEFMNTLTYFFHHSNGVRRLGSAAADLAYVACGRYDAFYEYGLKPWDLAAGTFIVEQAGGKVSDFSGGNNYLYGAELIASNRTIFSELQIAIEKIMHATKK